MQDRSPEAASVPHVSGRNYFTRASIRRLSAAQNGYASADAGDCEGRDENNGDELGVHGYCLSRPS